MVAINVIWKPSCCLVVSLRVMTCALGVIGMLNPTHKKNLRYFFLNVLVKQTKKTDSSHQCFGAVGMQKNRPIGYASRVLNHTERNYAHIEKEMCVITFACCKFHKFILANKRPSSMITSPRSECQRNHTIN